MCILEDFMINLQELLTGIRSCDNNIIRRHSRKLEQLGDISFPLNIKNWYHLLHVNKLQNNEQNIFDYNICQAELKTQTEELIKINKNWQINIERVEINANDVYLFLRRSSYFFKNVITEVLSKNNLYGSSEVIQAEVSLDMQCHVINKSLSELDLSSLRLLILKDVTSNLLTFETRLKTERKCSILFTLNSIKPDKTSILCGPVLNNNGVKDIQITAEELINKRSSDMRMMAQHKYGVQVKPNTSWKTYFDKLGRAAITIEMLSNKPHKALKITMHDLQTANKGASFIFYNCARVAVLFKELQKRIAANIYPELPDIEDIDFSLLNQPEEWELFYVYILQFPLVVKNCIRDVEKGIINPQYLVSFLSSLSSLFSTYYRRIRILTDPREHLYAVLHARVYLLKALQCVFHNALYLLNIEPIKEM